MYSAALNILIKILEGLLISRKRVSWDPPTLPLNVVDGYYVAYKPITLSYILFMFNEMKYIYCHSYVMFAMKSMSMCND